MVNSLYKLLGHIYFFLSYFDMLLVGCIDPMFQASNAFQNVHQIISSFSSCLPCDIVVRCTSDEIHTCKS